jgi:hypothetical protein
VRERNDIKNPADQVSRINTANSLPTGEDSSSARRAGRLDISRPRLRRGLSGGRWRASVALFQLAAEIGFSACAGSGAGF